MVPTEQATNSWLSCIEASDSPRPHQRHHIGGSRSPLDHRRDVSRPRIKRGALLGCPIVTLVDAGDADPTVPAHSESEGEVPFRAGVRDGLRDGCASRQKPTTTNAEHIENWFGRQCRIQRRTAGGIYRGR
jgi:hypothetical protein